MRSSLSFLALILILPACGFDTEGSNSRRITPGPEEGEDPPVLCWSDSDCLMGQACSTADVCMSPPGCDPGEACPAVCYGVCVDGPIDPPPPPPPPPQSCGDEGECPEGSHCDYSCPPCAECGACLPQCVPDAPPLPEQCETFSDCPSGYGCAETCGGMCEPNGGPCTSECHGECQPIGWCGDDDGGGTMPGGGGNDTPTAPIPF